MGEDTAGGVLLLSNVADGLITVPYPPLSLFGSCQGKLLQRRRLKPRQTSALAPQSTARQTKAANPKFLENKNPTAYRGTSQPLQECGPPPHSCGRTEQQRMVDG